MGTGKSSILKLLAKELPTHTPCYFDCTTKDLGDITIPKLNVLEGEDYVTYAVNEELGMHFNKPIMASQTRQSKPHWPAPCWSAVWVVTRYTLTVSCLPQLTLVPRVSVT